MSESADNNLDIRDTLLSPFLVDVVRGASETHFTPLVREGSVTLLDRSASIVGCFHSKLFGMLNTTEEGNLKFGRHRIEFLRKGYSGCWTLNGKREGDNVISFGRRWFYWGQSVTRVSDGTTIRIKMPMMGPSMRQLRNCVCTATLENGRQIHLFLARPDNQIQLVFDPSEIHLLEQMTEASRAILLGEYLRIRSNCSYGV